MTDPNYYKRRQDIIAAAAREDFDCASRALYKLLIHSIEVDDDHVLSYPLVKTALLVLAAGPRRFADRRYVNPDGTITLLGADKFCNYATTAVCLLYTTLMLSSSTDEDVLAAKLVMLSLFGGGASVEHVRSRCFELVFDVKPGNVIQWRGELFAELASACSERVDQMWEFDCLILMIARLNGKLKETKGRLYSANKAHEEEVRRLHSQIHYSVEMDEMYAAVMFIKGRMCPCGRPKKNPDKTPRGVSQSEAAEMFEVSVQTLAAWERGRRTPPRGYSTMLRLDLTRIEELKDCAAKYVAHRDAQKELRKLFKERKMRRMHREGMAERESGMIRDDLNKGHEC